MPRAARAKAPEDVKPEVTPELESNTTPEQTPETQPEVTPEPAPAPEPKTKPATAQPFAHVTNTSGQIIRTYTLENHGQNFRELAQEFAAKRGLTVK